MVDIKHILCPVDFSECSRRALDYAVAIARQYESSISALHVYHLVTPAIDIAPYVGPDALQPFSLTDIDRDQLVAQLNQFVEGEGGAGVEIHAVVREAMNVHREILAQAEALPADLLIMGTHGRSGFEHLMLGSVTEKVLRKATCPVLTVPRRMPDAVPVSPGIFRRILCAVDFSAPASAALRYALSLAARSGADVIVQHVMEFPQEAHEPFIEVSWQPAEFRRKYEQRSLERLRRMVPEAARKECHVEEVISGGRPYHEILRVAEERGCDLIALGVHGRNVVDRMLFGSTTQHVVRQATCRVLTLRQQ